MYWIGIDGGGTKTELMVSDEYGHILGCRRVGSTSYKHIGKSECMKILKESLDAIAKEIGWSDDSSVCTCCALPNFGESRTMDHFFKETVDEVLKNYHVHLVNDCEVGWAGSLGMEPGINLVAGTGAIVFGKDDMGNTARAGGWSDFFSDEGSCYWLGKRTMELFSKESDGRANRGALLDLMRNYFDLTDDFDMIDIFERDYQNNRTNVASLQKILLEAAKSGDVEAVGLYREAADELAKSVLAVYRHLKWNKTCNVSYSGGLFHAGDYVLKPLRKALEIYDINLKKPLYSPAKGALLMAAAYGGGKDAVETIKSAWS